MSKRARTGPAPAWAAGLLGLLALAGCQEADSAGGPSSSPATALAGREVKAVEVLLPAGGAAELVFWDQTMRREAQDLDIGLEIRQLPPGAPPQEQAGMIRAAARRGVSALVVVPAEAGAIAAALAEVRDGGTPVVVVGPPVDVPGKPIPRVAIANERDSLEKLVAIACEAMREHFFSARGPAVLLVRDPVDDRTRARMGIITQSLRAKGVEVLPEVHFQGLMEPAMAALETRIRERPELALVIGMDDQAVGGASIHRHNLKAGLDHRFVVAGLVSEQRSSILVEMGQCVAVIDVNLRGPAAEALRAAAALANGRSVPERIDVLYTLLAAKGRERTLFPFAPGKHKEAGLPEQGTLLKDYLTPGASPDGELPRPPGAR